MCIFFATSGNHEENKPTLTHIVTKTGPYTAHIKNKYGTLKNSRVQRI